MDRRNFGQAALAAASSLPFLSWLKREKREEYIVTDVAAGTFSDDMLLISECGFFVRMRNCKLTPLSDISDEMKLKLREQNNFTDLKGREVVILRFPLDAT